MIQDALEKDDGPTGQTGVFVTPFDTELRLGICPSSSPKYMRHSIAQSKSRSSYTKQQRLFLSELANKAMSLEQDSDHKKSSERFEDIYREEVEDFEAYWEKNWKEMGIPQEVIRSNLKRLREKLNQIYSQPSGSRFSPDDFQLSDEETKRFQWLISYSEEADNGKD